jgi:hypothetical protein
MKMIVIITKILFSFLIATNSFAQLDNKTEYLLTILNDSFPNKKEIKKNERIVEYILFSKPIVNDKIHYEYPKNKITKCKVIYKCEIINNCILDSSYKFHKNLFSIFSKIDTTGSFIIEKTISKIQYDTLVINNNDSIYFYENFIDSVSQLLFKKNKRFESIIKIYNIKNVTQNNSQGCFVIVNNNNKLKVNYNIKKTKECNNIKIDEIIINFLSVNKFSITKNNIIEEYDLNW